MWTFRWYSSILKQYGCADAAACQQQLGNRIGCDGRELWATVLLDGAVVERAGVRFVVDRGPVLRRPAIIVLLLFCVVLLIGGVLSPMIEVEAKISRLGLTFLGEPIAFADQVLYFQSKSVLEVFRTLITAGTARHVGGRRAGADVPDTPTLRQPGWVWSLQSLQGICTLCTLRGGSCQRLFGDDWVSYAIAGSLKPDCPVSTRPA